MSPSPMSPVSKMAHPIRTTSQDSTDAIRKRVCKACDRCRLKKSKCDGTSPCSRCRADNAICVFGERKKSHDKVYPKGYVEMLEQQQGQLVTALQEMYRRLSAAEAWTGPTLPESNGQPLTHDILAALNLLETKADGSGEVESFEEDCSKLQGRLLSEGAGYVQRRGSFSSDSDHSQHGQSRAGFGGLPTAKPPVFRESFAFNTSTSPSPLPQSPISRPPKQSHPVAQPSPLQQDPQFYQAEWAIPDMSSPEAIMRSRFATAGPNWQGQSEQPSYMNDEPMDFSQLYDEQMAAMPSASYPQQLVDALSGGMPGMFDSVQYDPMMDLELSKFIHVNS